MSGAREVINFISVVVRVYKFKIRLWKTIETQLPLRESAYRVCCKGQLHVTGIQLGGPKCLARE